MFEGQTPVTALGSYLTQFCSVALATHINKPLLRKYERIWIQRGHFQAN